MNKNDIKLIFVLFIIVFSVYLFRLFFKQDGKKIAVVYYENKIVQKIDLESEDSKQYVVQGYNGDVVIEKKNGKIRVVEENSLKHLCSKQGYISSTYESIVCLPNKIVIQIVADEELDTVVR